MRNQYNPISRYTKEISHPILTKEKEVGIAQKIERAIKENDKKAEMDAKEELIRHNLKLVVSVARDTNLVVIMYIYFFLHF